MKTIDVGELRKKQQKENKQRQKGVRGKEAIVKVWELDDFVMHLTGFLQLICI